MRSVSIKSINSLTADSFREILAPRFVDLSWLRTGRFKFTPALPVCVRPLLPLPAGPLSLSPTLVQNWTQLVSWQIKPDSPTKLVDVETFRSTQFLVTLVTGCLMIWTNFNYFKMKTKHLRPLKKTLAPLQPCVSLITRRSSAWQRSKGWKEIPWPV